MAAVTICSDFGVYIYIFSFISVQHPLTVKMCPLVLFNYNKTTTEICNLGPPAPLPQGSWKTSSVFMFLGLLPQGPGWLGVRGIFKSN